MGYVYTVSGRLTCDGCGMSGGVRKRTCPFKVTDENLYVMNYCSPPALCSVCYHKEGGLHGVHGDACRLGAEKSNEEYATWRKKLLGGDLKVRSAFGAWHAAVPSGFVGVIFSGVGASEETEVKVLMPKELYDPAAKKFLSDYDALSLMAWETFDWPVSKRAL